MFSNSAPNIWFGEISFAIRPCTILIISVLNYYLSHKSSKAIRMCILYRLASALTPFHGKMFVEMFVSFSQSGQTQRTIHRTFEVNVEHCSLNCLFVAFGQGLRHPSTHSQNFLTSLKIQYVYLNVKYLVFSRTILDL